MGDRANIVVYEPQAGADPHEAVFLYTHWSGYELPATLKAGLERGTDRWEDAPYLARILFQEMIGSDRRTTGYGISTRMGDNSYPLLVVDVARGFVVEYPEREYEAHGFANLANYKGVEFASYRGRWAKEMASESA